MDELLALQAELARVQSAPSAFKLSEPNVIEVVQKLSALGLVEGVVLPRAVPRAADEAAGAVVVRVAVALPLLQAARVAARVVVAGALARSRVVIVAGAAPLGVAAPRARERGARGAPMRSVGSDGAGP